MAADILLYDADIVPVGKDQEQHLEFARVLARKVNNQFGKGVENSILIEPQAKHQENASVVPGVDGLDSKMSKSKGNTIHVLSPTDKQLKKKQIGAIVTDSTPLEEPKEPNNVVTALLELVDPERAVAVREKLAAGNYGHGHAKGELTESLLDFFGDAREKYAWYMEHPQELDALLEKGEAKARVVAQQTLARVREVVGY